MLMQLFALSHAGYHYLYINGLILNGHKLPTVKGI